MNVLNKFNLKGKTALVTGCKRGIGKAMAIGLAEAGADIIGVSASLEKHGSLVEQEIKKDEVMAFAKFIVDEVGEVDILVNNAGTILRAPAVEHSDEYWDKVIEVNQNAQFILTREIGKEMVARREGKIVFTASLLTFQGGITVPGYAASKGAIGQMTMAFANEWAGKGMNVNAIASGYISTDNTEALRNNPERATSILSRIPAERWGEPYDFKGPIVFLCSEASAYMNGSTILVDGGWMGR